MASSSRRAVLTGLGVVSPKRPGEIVGASDAIGHRIRDRVNITPSEDQWDRASVVIVGGGVAGLSAAWRLLKAGFEDFVLIELEEAPGGTARSGTSPLVSYPWGAHYLPAPMKMVPGTKMTYGGLKNPSQLEDLIAYLDTLN